MQNTPKSMRLQIAVAGRVNVGKSTFLNLAAGQDVAITSPQAGTTTDVVEKAMELPPLGPVLFMDTAGFDDNSDLGEERIKRSMKALDRADVILLLTRPGVWGRAEEDVAAVAAERKVPLLTVVNKCDEVQPEEDFIRLLTEKSGNPPLRCSALHDERNDLLDTLKQHLLEILPEELLTPPPMLADLLSPGDDVILIVPIDLQAPKGRLILPQVQAIRDILDAGAVAHVCKENDYTAALNNLHKAPALVVGDSQAVSLMVKETPENIPCTTFSILMARMKGDLNSFIRGAVEIDRLQPGDRVLIAESCTHHAGKDDIGKVKIPRLLEKRAGGGLDLQYCAGHDFPEDLSSFKLMVHCGACMLNRREMLRRQHLAEQSGVPVVNYGMAISCCQGVLDRVIAPFRKK